ncbi:class I SAM-dependent methyltransferase [Vallitalea okinawensis]|uniref:class I SAM-dependent methyltransferase n=1 Tax=Vallitalea okinawensis TaxID=2078660 RepID=UPI000CFD018B|nr:class I SAM-dependent methyltransferase [Vallitalea okinawensis]
MDYINIESLKRYVELPTVPFEEPKTQEVFWDDDHISKCMLEAHLNPEWDAASRKKETIEKTTNWLINRFKLNKDSRLIDLGCGPGLYCQKLSKNGVNITGMDYSKRSIEFAKKAAKEEGLSIQYMYQDYLTMDFEKEFHIALMIYCDFGVLNVQAQKKLLSNIHRSIKEDGYFVFDVFTPVRKDLVASFKHWNIQDKGGFWSAEPYIELQEKTYDEENQLSLMKHTILKDDRVVKTYNLWEQVYTPETISKLLSQNGFEVIEIYNGLTGNKYTNSTDLLGVVARKKNV